jgi:DNA-binding MarR family transcriptional regulator
MALAEHEPITQADLAEAFAVAPASMSVMLVRLERDGLIQRHETHGAFRTAVSLTVAGRALLNAIRAAWQRVDQRLVDALGPHDARTLSQLALRLRDDLGGRGPPEVLRRAKGEDA